MKLLKGSWWMILTVYKIVLNFFFPIFFLTGDDFSVLLLPPSISKQYQRLNLNSANCSKLYHAEEWYGTNTSWVCCPSPGFELMPSTQNSVISCCLHQSISLPLLISEVFLQHLKFFIILHPTGAILSIKFSLSAGVPCFGGCHILCHAHTALMPQLLFHFCICEHLQTGEVSCASR